MTEDRMPVPEKKHTKKAPGRGKGIISHKIPIVNTFLKINYIIYIY
jgi:hypothetical protein